MKNLLVRLKKFEVVCAWCGEKWYWGLGKSFAFYCPRCQEEIKHMMNYAVKIGALDVDEAVNKNYDEMAKWIKNNELKGWEN